MASLEIDSKEIGIREEGATEEVRVPESSESDSSAASSADLTPMNNARSTMQILDASWKGLKSLGLNIFAALQNVGEGVADFLGLNDSKFQYVIDTMTEEDWRKAEEVDKTRRRQLGEVIVDEEETGHDLEAPTEEKVVER